MKINWCFATPAEKLAELPGDPLIANPTMVSTHAITINVTADRVWPWIVQMGQDRGGFYSYTFAENLLGCRMKNADQIYGKWQHVELGDPVRLHPRFPPMYLKQFEKNKNWVLWQEARFVWTWAFTLIAQRDRSCRLIVRSRISSKQWLTTALLYPVMTLGHYLMERRMLVGIKQRSESTPPLS